MKKWSSFSGPRQVGKTTLAKEFSLGKEAYLNWDIAQHREKILKHQLPDSPIWIFDEIHNFKGWRNFLKGLYDQDKGQKKILVTDSAKLGVYRYGGDSLQGRYHHLRMHPLTIGELGLSSQQEVDSLFSLSGFPEPYFKERAVDMRRWSRNYRSLLIKEEVTSLENIDDLGKFELMMLRLPELVGSPLSINSLREGLEKSHRTLSKWLNILESLYSIFRLSPFGSPKIRAVKKEQKHYHFNWFDVEDPGKKFENFVACHLLKWVQWQQDVEGEDFDLQYFRDTDKREIDFVITRKRKPLYFIECKLSAGEISGHLKYMKAKFPKAHFFQLYFNGQDDFIDRNGIVQSSCLRFFTQELKV